MKHVIVEGMDGSGKDTLIEALLKLMPDHTLHERASTSLGGPVANVGEWVAKDFLTMEDASPSIYNRHPLVSEPIYAPIRQANPGLRGVWRQQIWIDTYRRLVADQAVLVICQPPFPTVQNNLLRNPSAHMAGVVPAMSHLYESYQNFTWPGRVIRYNYRNDRPRHLVTALGRVLSW